MKRILILGAGNAQIDLIEYCKESGFEVHGISYSDTDKGISYLDYFKQINIIDATAVKEYVKEHQIEVVYSVGSDLAMPSVMEVAKACGLNYFTSPESAIICNNKEMLREKLGEDYKWNVPYYSAESIDVIDEELKVPVMVKPVDSQGQRGVYRANTLQELKDGFTHAKEFSRCGNVIIEEFIEGDEVSVNTYLQDGKIVFLLLSDREAFSNLPGGIIKAHHVPSRYEHTETKKEVEALVEEAAKRVGITNGPAYFQIKIRKGKPYLIEMTPRLDGCHMWRLIKEYTGVDLLSITMKHLVEGVVEVPSYETETCPMHLEFFCEKPGTIFERSKYEGYNAGYSKFYYETGDTVKSLNGFMEKCGYRIFASPKKIGLIGGGGFIGSQFKKMYEGQYELVDISRSNGLRNYSAEQITKALKGCDSVVIFAGKKVDPKEKQCYSIYEDNVRVVEHTLMACQQLGIKNVVSLSSRCVYSTNQDSPVKEDGKIAPINYYGISKYAGEMVCGFYNEYHGMNCKVLRLSQVLGMGETNGYMFNTFVKLAKEKKTLQVWGSGLGKRDYIYIKDVCYGIEAALLGYEKQGTYNLSSGKGMSTVDMAEAVCSAFGNDGNYELLTDKPEDKVISYFDGAKFKEEFGFSCKYTLETMLQEMKGEGFDA